MKKKPSKQKPSKQKIHVYATFRVAGCHQWVDAPEEFAYLSAQHRHVFHFKVTAAVTHDNRDIEFIDMGTFARTRLVNLYHYSDFGGTNFGAHSCEMIAHDLYEGMVECDKKYKGRIVSIEVSEDGENGAVVYF